MKYIKCDNCGRMIPFGKGVYKDRMHITLYCSARCLVFDQRLGSKIVLNDAVAEEHEAEVFEE